MNIEASYLDKMRSLGDRNADNLVSEIFKLNHQQQLYSVLSIPDDKIYNTDESLIKDFILTQKQKPSWLNEELLIEGQMFFRKHALDIMSLLGSMSLPYCYAASPGNKAIYLTEKMRHHPGKRLVDTAHFIITVMEPGAFKNNGLGFIQINKTRLIHSLVRYHIVNKADWNMEWGMPVNQEDMAGTNLAFSYIILVGLKRAKYKISAQEEESLNHAWRYIGYLLDIKEELLPATFEEAALLERTIRERNFSPSTEGHALMHDLVKHYKNTLPLVPGYLVDGQIRYCIGKEISQLLGLKHQPVKDSLVCLMNKLKESINSFYIYPASYRTMMRNHIRLRNLYN